MKKEKQLELEEKVFNEISNSLKNNTNPFDFDDVSDDGITLTNGDSKKYRIERNFNDEFDDSFGLCIFDDNEIIKFTKRPKMNGGPYDEFYISLKAKCDLSK